MKKRKLKKKIRHEIKKYIAKQKLKLRSDQSLESKAKVLRGFDSRDLLSNLIDQLAGGNRAVFGSIIGVDRRMIRSYLSATHRPPWFLVLLLRALAARPKFAAELQVLARKE